MMPPALLSLPRSSSPSVSPSPLCPGRRSAAVQRHRPSIPSKPAAGICYASQAVELLPSLYPGTGVVVRDAKLEDCWEVADTHCSSFFPGYKFPLDLVLRLDRYIALLSGFSVPPGCTRSCLVAVNPTAANSAISIECGDLRDAEFHGKYGLSKGSVAGILTVDTVADFLPRRGRLKQRRTGIAYIANVAVRKEERRKGIAKMLVAEAEARARSWGCRSVALHCDVSNLAALRLYKSQGYKSIRIPEDAKWPIPKIAEGVRYEFMMKLVPKS
ncbi:uncharacterized protein LOC123403901 isoform X1 [Hordeum vulgare subsp. vulgare]|uniref:N-acetyltransferase domain-containing protein n=1 Tax=Hordeum vulgare subsp. vulgare TaxID=112509 RepID=A0A8I7BCP9_HORVV|nr:uncharacterized protein LOC123403901 isoform X1 [Hordeum vulgare subsp. vulgare]